MSELKSAKNRSVYESIREGFAEDFRKARDYNRIRAYEMFYGQNKTLEEIAKELECSIYDLSPWLTAACTRIALDACKQTRTSPPALTPDERSKLVEDVANCVLESMGEIEGFGDKQRSELLAGSAMFAIEQRYALVPKVRG
jgi:hypothetical protein